MRPRRDGAEWQKWRARVRDGVAGVANMDRASETGHAEMPRAVSNESTRASVLGKERYEDVVWNAGA